MAAEKQFENKIKKYLHSVGVYQAGTPTNKMQSDQVGWFTKIWGGGYQKSGIPDLVLCVNGFFISVEVKSSVGKASELQKMNTSRINRSNGIGIILFPNGFDDFKQLIKGVIACKYHIQELNSLRETHSNTSCVILTN